MSNTKINERIVEVIKEESKTDKFICEFLIRLLYKEVEHPGQWWHYKDFYRKLIGEYSQKRSGLNEDR